ncbi:MAG: DUF885 family protein, partial [Lysobacterales bacterium]
MHEEYPGVLYSARTAIDWIPDAPAAFWNDGGLRCSSLARSQNEPAHVNWRHDAASVYYPCFLGHIGSAQAQTPALNPALQALAAQFFEWRRVQQPVSGDDIPRVERPAGWLPALSPEDLALDRARYREYLKRLTALDRSGYSRADEVDALLLSSAINRAGWELDVLRSPNRNPLFYLDQSLGSVFELLVLAPPVTEARMNEVMLRLQHFPIVVADAETNLTEGIQSFAIAAVDFLMDIQGTMAAVQAGLAPLLQPGQEVAFDESMATATEALVSYRTWLQGHIAGMDTSFSVGERAYRWFLVNVALLPFTPDELLLLGRQARNRAVTFDVLEKNRNRDLPPLPLFKSARKQIETSFHNEREIRTFLESQDLLTVPAGLMHYRNLPLPPYLQALSFMGVTDDLTSESRPGEDAISYIPEPAENLPFFADASARDPRPLIAHAGIPGHYFQLVMSWANPDPIRRHYFDTAANEGIGFYAEEMMLQAGLFSFSPQSRETVYRLMRLRALRVEVDIRLATGEFTIEAATEYLARRVP